MPRKPAACPSYRKHSTSDRAFAEYLGKRFYFPGPFGSPKSRAGYRQFLREHVGPLSARRDAAEDYDVKYGPDAMPISVAVIEFLDWASEYYPDDRTSEYSNLHFATQHLLDAFGEIPIEAFGPRKLRAIQTALANQKKSRRYTNDVIRRIRSFFKWAVSEELVSANVYLALTTVPGLRKNRSTATERPAREPVAWQHVALILPYLSPPVEAMVLLQWYTGVRPGSMFAATPGQFDRSKNPWRWKPKHKMEFAGQNLIVPIGPRCQTVILPFFDRPEDGLLFSTVECGRNNPRYNRSYNATSYRNAVGRAIARANADREKIGLRPIPDWTPYQIRHAKASDVREEYGLESAQAMLGHKSVSATQIYARRLQKLAERVAMETG